MIDIDIHRFRLANYARVKLDKDDEWAIPEGTNCASMGVLVLRGSTEVIECDDATVVGKTYPTAPTIQPVPNIAYTIRATEDVEWVCISDNDSGPRALAYQPFNAVCSIPTDWGFIVVSGETFVDGVPVPVDSCYLPRDHEVVVTATGDAQIILIK